MKSSLLSFTGLTHENIRDCVHSSTKADEMKLVLLLINRAPIESNAGSNGTSASNAAYNIGI